MPSSYWQPWLSPVAFNVLCEIPELKNNPFKDRILRVFSDDGTGDMLFGEPLAPVRHAGHNTPLSPRGCRRIGVNIGVH